MSIIVWMRQQDQYPSISDHTHKGIDFLDKYGAFVKERCAIEIEYAGKLKRLAKHYQLKKKDTDNEDNQWVRERREERREKEQLKSSERNKERNSNRNRKRDDNELNFIQTVILLYQFKLVTPS